MATTPLKQIQVVAERTTQSSASDVLLCQMRDFVHPLQVVYKDGVIHPTISLVRIQRFIFLQCKVYFQV